MRKRCQQNYRDLMEALEGRELLSAAFAHNSTRAAVNKMMRFRPAGAVVVSNTQDLREVMKHGGTAIFGGGVTRGKPVVVSSTAVSHPNGFGARASGIFINADVFGGGANGILINTDGSGSVITATTFNGDASLDGHLDLADLSPITNHWHTNLTNWVLGDVTFDGIVDINDLTEVAHNWVAGVGPGFSHMTF